MAHLETQGSEKWIEALLATRFHSPVMTGNNPLRRKPTSATALPLQQPSKPDKHPGLGLA